MRRETNLVPPGMPVLTGEQEAVFSRPDEKPEEEKQMGKAFILWLFGVPTSMIVVLYLCGFLH